MDPAAPYWRRRFSAPQSSSGSCRSSPPRAPDELKAWLDLLDGFVSNVPAATALDQISFPFLVRIKTVDQPSGLPTEPVEMSARWRHNRGRRGSLAARTCESP